MTTTTTWQLTHHAHERAREFGLELEDVARIATDPEVTYASTAPRHPSGRVIAQRGRWAVVLSGSVVVTVLRRRCDRWEHA